jgi:hypothetical protein
MPRGLGRERQTPGAPRRRRRRSADTG